MKSCLLKKTPKTQEIYDPKDVAIPGRLAGAR